jgi:hypothetical protein
MAGKFECPECGRSYARKDSLVRHQKKEHGSASLVQQSLDVGEARVDVEAPAGAEEEKAEGFSPGVLKRALADLGIDAEDVMAHRVYPDRVVIIQGPAGFKRVWRPESK